VSRNLGFCSIFVSLTRNKKQMRPIRNINLIKILALTVLLVAPFAVSMLFAQVAPPPPPPPPAGVPIDGGIALLLSGLAAYGAKKYFKK
jgi:hypothetical protein